MKKEISIPLRIGLIIYMFLCIFNPDFFPLEMVSLMTYVGITIVLLFICNQNGITFRKELIYPLRVFSPFLVYFLSITFIFCFSSIGQRGGFLNNFTAYIIPLSKWYVAYLVFYYITLSYKLDTNDYMSLLVMVGIIQTICVIIALISPPIRNVFNGFTIANSQSQHMKNYVLMNNQRSFGLADNLFDSFGYTTSFIIVYTFILSISKNIKYILIFLAMLLMPLLNTRTGILLVGICGALVALYFYSTVFIKKWLRTAATVIIIMLCVMALYSIVPEDTKEWIEDGFESIYVLFSSGEKTSGFAVMDRMIGIPEHFIIGECCSPESLGRGATDIGYVQCIWRFGLIGTALLLYGFFRVFKLAYVKAKSKEQKCFSICAGLIFFVYLYKLYSIGNPCGNFIIFTWLAVIINDDCNENENHVYHF
ncbi:MAG: M50 family metallopeptidase [Ruminococcus sp.]|uniref:M50 family metallopeptidase n=1 Tax=Ruminococcus sp. TaxID=41978 RepID=UPI0025FA05F1|nr:M50 family metallopeptidase [Ruminococcus sp.]MCR5600622.1 M50 family metallopeptidase [Ruminococcus sp.]